MFPRWTCRLRSCCRFESLKQADDDLADQSETDRAAMIERVKAHMPVQVQWAIVEVDNVHGRDAALPEGNVIVFDSAAAVEKIPVVSQIMRFAEHDGVQPASRIQIAKDVQVGVCDHIHHDYGTELRQRSFACESRHKVTASV